MSEPRTSEYIFFGVFIKHFPNDFKLEMDEIVNAVEDYVNSEDGKIKYIEQIMNECDSVKEFMTSHVVSLVGYKLHGKLNDELIKKAISFRNDLFKFPQIAEHHGYIRAAIDEHIPIQFQNQLNPL